MLAIRNPCQGAAFVEMLRISLNTLAAWPPGNLPACGPLPRSDYCRNASHFFEYARRLASREPSRLRAPPSERLALAADFRHMSRAIRNPRQGAACSCGTSSHNQKKAVLRMNEFLLRPLSSDCTTHGQDMFANLSTALVKSASVFSASPCSSPSFTQ